MQAFHVFGGFIQGFVMMEHGSIEKSQGERGAFDMPESEVPADAFPILHAVHQYFADCSADEQFEFGLDLLVRGLRDRATDGP